MSKKEIAPRRDPARAPLGGLVNRFRSVALALTGFVLLVASSPAQQAQAERESVEPGKAQPTPPRNTDLVERTGQQLVQIDVTVTGPEERIINLVADDFELKIGSDWIRDFTFDRVCADPAAAKARKPSRKPSRKGKQDDAPTDAAETPDDPTAAAQALPPTNPVTNWIFYFEQAFLTVAGRVQAIEMAEELVRELVDANDRVTIVSSGQVLKTFADQSSDAEQVIAAFQTIESDPTQWYPNLESDEKRIQQVVETLNDPNFGGTDVAMGWARRYQQEETWLVDKAFTRFSMTIGRFADLPAPKAVIYFADRIRKAAGQHYVDMFSSGMFDNLERANMETRAQQAQHAFDRVVNEANAYGVRLYTIQAEGLVGGGSIADRGTTTRMPTSHIRLSQQSLQGLAAETGGRAFINGVRTSKIVKAIREDLSCIYLLSFDAEKVARDRSLPVLLRAKERGIEVRTRGQLYVPSRGKRQVSRLMAAFAASDVVSSDSMRGALIPLNYEDGKYQAFLQVQLEGSPLPNASWDVGASVLSRDKVRDEFSTRLKVPQAGATVIVESMLELPPGPFEISLVGHDQATDRIVTAQVAGDWPKLRGESFVVVPVAVLQQSRGAFVRDGANRSQGSLAFSGIEPVDTARATALRTLVCRGNVGSKKPVDVIRRLAGDSAATFEPYEISLKDYECVTVQDYIPPDIMTPGEFEFEVQVQRNGDVLTERSRRFGAWSEQAASTGGETE